MTTLLAKLGRSYLFALISLLLGTGLCLFHHIDGPSFVALVIALAGIVAGRAVGEDFAPKA